MKNTLRSILLALASTRIYFGNTIKPELLCEQCYEKTGTIITMIFTLIGTKQHYQAYQQTLSAIEKQGIALKPFDDFTVQAVVTDKQQTILQPLLASPQPIDYFFQPADRKAKKILLADMDSTIVTSETLDDLAAKAGVGQKVAAITTRAMNGEIDFVAALHERVGLLAGLPTSLLKDVWQEIEFTKGAKALIRGLKKEGMTCILVSGGFHYFADQVKEALGFDYAYANTLNFDAETLAGTVKTPILTGQTKKEILLKHCDDLGTSVTIGDGANDLPMLLAASEAGGLGIAYHAKPVVQKQAKYNLRYATLEAVLPLVRI